MISYQRAIAVALHTFGASVVGMALQLVVPEQVCWRISKPARVGAMVGVNHPLAGARLGLFPAVYTAFTVYSDTAGRGAGKGSAPW